MPSWIHDILFLAVIRPLLWGGLGLVVRHRERLPARGPAILIANHNSHLDALILMALFPHRLLDRLRPVVAAEYFRRTRLRRWVAFRLLHAIALDRQACGRCDILAPCLRALDDDAILIFFPEGTRGEPGRLAALRVGIAHLAARRPQVPIVPIYLVGTDRVLPKGSVVPVPILCSAVVGPPLGWGGDRVGFLAAFDDRLRALEHEAAGASGGELGMARGS